MKEKKISLFAKMERMGMIAWALLVMARYVDNDRVMISAGPNVCQEFHLGTGEELSPTKGPTTSTRHVCMDLTIFYKSDRQFQLLRH